MLRDFLANSINDVYPLIERLAEQERGARRGYDPALRRQAEEQARALRNQLLEKADASLVYLYLAASEKADADLLRNVWRNNILRTPDAAFHRLREWGLKQLYETYWAAPTVDLSILPAYSFTIRFTFTLAAPYISKDDNSFYIIDNPIVRDRVFRLPMVRSTSWKGSLYAALWRLGHDRQDQEPMRRLFGEIRTSAGGEEKGRAGRLFFYPTFFTRMGLEIINPHDRKRRVGKNPILFESVPIGAEGTFTLLYVPFDRVGQDPEETAGQVAEDLRLLAKGLQALFTIYGFGAKTSSGFGVAHETVKDGTLTLRIQGLAASPSEAPAAPAPRLPRYLEAPGRLRPEYLTPEGHFRERSEAELKAMKKADRQLYEKAKAWWEREGKALAGKGSPPGAAVPSQPSASAPIWPSWKFTSFTELVNRADQIAQQLTKGGTL
ncbi:MAG TPA: RAMP superfamily CRISPR-associated protein [Thermoflexus sp.]|nr:RAMP superfamily CRISPR-associated protein [Thermoflexus sp.]